MSIPISTTYGPMHFALTWQEGYPVSGVDTDLSAMMYTEKGEFVDVCYFNKLAVDGGAIALSGDARSGNPGAPPSDLEALTMHLQGVAPQTKYIFVCISVRTGPECLQGASLRVSDGGAPGGRFMTTIPLCYAPPNTSAIVVALVRPPPDLYPPTWNLQYINIPGPHRDFKGSQALVEQYLHHNVDPRLLSQRSPNNPAEFFSLHKLQSYYLDPSVQHMTFGLGWDKIGEEGVNLDAVCLIMDEWYQTLGRVSRGSSFKDAVKHSGDDETGEGSGDDERIKVRLERMPQEVKHIALFVDGLTGGRIGRAFFRLKSDAGFEMCRYDVDSEKWGSASAQLMVCLSRVEGDRWQLIPLDVDARSVNYMPLVRSTRPDLMEKIHISITPICGRDLAVKDEKKGTSDPYVKVKFFDGSAEKNDKIKKTLNPDWDTSKPTVAYTGPIAGCLKRASAKIDIFDYDKWSINDFMGRVRLHIGHCLIQRNRGPQELTLPVEQQHPGESKDISGTITFSYECKSVQ